MALFLFDGRVTELSEVRDPIIPAIVSGYPEMSVVVSDTNGIVFERHSPSLKKCSISGSWPLCHLAQL